MSIFSKRIKDLRTKNNLTGEQLGQKVGITKTGVSYWESGKSIPNDETLIQLSKLFGVSIDYLLGNTDIEDSNIYGNHNANLDYFKDKPEVLQMYKEIYDSKDLKILFDTARELTPKELEKVLNIMKLVIEEEE